MQFERAYELKPNYKVLYNIGQTYFQLREYVEARDSMTRYVKEGGEATLAFDEGWKLMKYFLSS